MGYASTLIDLKFERHLHRYDTSLVTALYVPATVEIHLQIKKEGCFSLIKRSLLPAIFAYMPLAK